MPEKPPGPAPDESILEEEDYDDDAPALESELPRQAHKVSRASEDTDLLSGSPPPWLSEPLRIVS